MQAKTVSVGPVTAAVTNQIAASQTPYAGQLILNGAGGAYSVNDIATSQTPSGAGYLTLTGNVIAWASPRYVYVTSAGNDTSITFKIYGYDPAGNPFQETITGANTKARATTRQFAAVSAVYASAAAAGAVTVGSFGAATFTGSTARQVTVTPGSDERTNTFTVTGLDLNGSVMSESMTGNNATASTTNSFFASVYSITLANNAAGTIIAGMTNTAASPWIRFDDFAPSNISLQCTVSGSATYTVQSSLDDPNSLMSPVAIGSMTWVSSSDTNVVAATGTKQSNFLFAPKFARVYLTTTSTGSVTMTTLQSSNGPA